MMNFQLVIIVHFSKDFFMKTEKKKHFSNHESSVTKVSFVLFHPVR